MLKYENKNKQTERVLMGFGTIFAGVIMIPLFVFALFSLFVSYKTTIDTSQTGTRLQQERMSNKINTQISITEETYFVGTTTIALNLTNMGSTNLELTYIDAYVDAVFIPRNDSNRTFEIINDLGDSQLWDPGEHLTLNITYPLSAGDHYIEVTTQYGVKDAVTITV